MRLGANTPGTGDYPQANGSAKACGSHPAGVGFIPTGTGQRSRHEARQQTGPLGLSTAEAAAFLAHRLANAALSDPLDAEAISFYAVQIMGWKAFAEADFLDPTKKPGGETKARQQQEERLRELWQAHSLSDEAE